MALVKCRDCTGDISTEAVACPHCGAAQQSFFQAPTVQPPVLPQMEQTIYSDGAITITNLRIIIGGTTYALRNVTSVKMLFTPPRLVKPILLLVIGLMILLAAFMPMSADAPAPVGVYILAGAMIGGAILWMCNIKAKYHVGLSSSSGEVHALTSNNKEYVRRIMMGLNEAMVKSQ